MKNFEFKKDAATDSSGRVTAAEYNSAFAELKNAITKNGLQLDEADNEQLSRIIKKGGASTSIFQEDVLPSYIPSYDTFNVIISYPLRFVMGSVEIVDRSDGTARRIVSNQELFDEYLPVHLNVNRRKAWSLVTSQDNTTEGLGIIPRSRDGSITNALLVTTNYYGWSPIDDYRFSSFPINNFKINVEKSSAEKLYITLTRPRGTAGAVTRTQDIPTQVIPICYFIAVYRSSGYDGRSYISQTSVTRKVDNTNISYSFYIDNVYNLFSPDLDSQMIIEDFELITYSETVDVLPFYPGDYGDISGDTPLILKDYSPYPFSGYPTMAGFPGVNPTRDYNNKIELALLQKKPNNLKLPYITLNNDDTVTNTKSYSYLEENKVYFCKFAFPRILPNQTTFNINGVSYEFNLPRAGKLPSPSDDLALEWQVSRTVDSQEIYAFSAIKTTSTTVPNAIRFHNLGILKPKTEYPEYSSKFPYFFTKEVSYTDGNIITGKYIPSLWNKIPFVQRSISSATGKPTITTLIYNIAIYYTSWTAGDVLYQHVSDQVELRRRRTGQPPGGWPRLEDVFEQNYLPFRIRPQDIIYKIHDYGYNTDWGVLSSYRFHTVPWHFNVNNWRVLFSNTLVASKITN